MCSYTGYGLWFTLRLKDEGNKVDYYLMDKKYSKVLDGIAPTPFYNKPDFSKYDLVIFDLTGKPKLAEEAAKVTNVIGDSELASELEDDRMFGIEVMEQCGIEVPPYETFSDIEAAKKFIRETKKRYVFKPNGGQDQECASTYVSTSAEDMLEYIDRLGEMAHGVEFLLQEVVDGTEVSTEAYFDGEDFYLINGTLEEKKFMDNRKGPNTGCAGNLVWAYRRTPKIFTEGLQKLSPFLQESGYRGMIDLNTIAAGSHLYGLEWTPRFGYDASATLFRTIGSPLGEFLHGIASGQGSEPDVVHDYAAALRLSIPPYPSECEGYFLEDVPINGIEPEDLEHTYMYDACLDKEDNLVTAGCSGFIAVPIGCGPTIRDAFARMSARVKKVKIPDMQHRNDIYKCTWSRYEVLEREGWFRPND
jgi:phosphoribosylamine---glycine ligase